jgi:hypothetical protein
MSDLLRDLWTRPDPELVGIHDIFDYALTFDGHSYAQDVLHEELHDCAGDLAKQWNGPERDKLDFVRLRLLLFWEQDCAHHAWQPGGCVRRSADPAARIWDQSRPTEEDLRRFRDLYEAICRAWEREWPGVRDSLEARHAG